ncbi:MerR family transcriptional regulator [Pseudolysinimonas sp.]|jgi:MerR family copper efflux transcriptional regulator|uniref:helix-turn-helix domain-containing protein n=1 Tax=Pseudolysinimonas sp. TaxID=2680009 RepID=UPI003783EABE
MKSSSWSIGDTAARFALPTHVLRHWEDVGLLAPARDSGGRRRYTDADVVRVAVIVRSKAAGMALDQIRVLLDEEALERHAILEAHLAELDARMRELASARAMTAHAFECDQHDITTCPNFVATVADLLDGGTWPSDVSNRVGA